MNTVLCFNTQCCAGAFMKEVSCCSILEYMNLGLSPEYSYSLMCPHTEGTHYHRQVEGLLAELHL